MLNPDHFVYHPPTPETAPKYAAIRAGERVAIDAFEAVWAGSTTDPQAFNIINAAALFFATAIDEYAPDSADKAAAIRCVRLARNAANEQAQMLRASGGSGGDREIERQALDNLCAARWQANSAIACGGK